MTRKTKLYRTEIEYIEAIEYLALCINCKKHQLPKKIYDCIEKALTTEEKKNIYSIQCSISGKLKMYASDFEFLESNKKPYRDKLLNVILYIYRNTNSFKEAFFSLMENNNTEDFKKIFTKSLQCY